MEGISVLAHATTMLKSLVRLTGYSDDVARWLIAVAKNVPEKFALVEYEGEILCATSDSHLSTIVRIHERLLARSKQRQPSFLQGEFAWQA
jgi:hypothetical protein